MADRRCASSSRRTRSARRTAGRGPARRAKRWSCREALERRSWSESYASRIAGLSEVCCGTARDEGGNWEQGRGKREEGRGTTKTAGTEKTAGTGNSKRERISFAATRSR